MSTEEIEGGFIVKCDDCDDVYIGYGRITKVARDWKEAGWMCYKRNGNFRHYCPECKEEHLESYKKQKEPKRSGYKCYWESA